MADTPRTSVRYRDNQTNGMEGPRTPVTAASGDEGARLTAWEQFLTTRKPIIAPDGYIPNSVVRAVLGHVTSGHNLPVPVWQAVPQLTFKAPDANVAYLSSSHPMPASSYREETTTSNSQEHDTRKQLSNRNGSKSRRSSRSGRRSAQRTPSASDTKSQGRRQEAKEKGSTATTKQMLKTRTRADGKNITRDGVMAAQMGTSMFNNTELEHNNVLDYQTSHLAISPTNKSAVKTRKQYDENMAETDFVDAASDPTTTISKHFNSKGLNDFEDDALDVCDDRGNGDEEHISMSSSSVIITDRSLPQHSNDVKGQSSEINHAGSPRPLTHHHHVGVEKRGHASSDSNSGTGTLRTPAATTDIATQETRAAAAAPHTPSEVPETWTSSGKCDSEERKAADTQERDTSKTSNSQDGRTTDTEERETAHAQVRLTSDALNRLTGQERETSEAHEETHSRGIPEEERESHDKYSTAAKTEMKINVTEYVEGAEHGITMDSEEKEACKSPLINHLNLFLSRHPSSTTGQVSLHSVRMHKDSDIGEGFCYDHVVDNVYDQPLLKSLQRNEVTERDVVRTSTVLSRSARHAKCKIPGEIIYRLSQTQKTSQVAPSFPHTSEMRATSHMREYLSPDMRAEELTPVNSTQSFAFALQPARTHQCLWTKENAVSATRGLQGKLPTLTCHGGQDLTSGRVLRAAEFVLRQPGAHSASEPEPGPGMTAVDSTVRHQHQCEHARLAQKKMHHYTSISRYLANKDLMESLTHLRKPFSWTHERARVHQLLKAQY